jgi:hypothetical protein
MTLRGSAPTSFIFSRRSSICKHVVGRARCFPLSSNVRPDLANNSRRFCAVPDSVQARRFAKVANNAERFETRGSVKAGAQSAT